jgi:LysR substrate binding domain.
MAGLLERCEFLMEEAQKTYDSLVRNMQQASGLIRVCMFRDLYDRHMKKALLKFADMWPDIRLHLTCVEHPVDMRTDPYDVAFLIGPSIAEPLVGQETHDHRAVSVRRPQSFDRYPVPANPWTCTRYPASCCSDSGAAGPCTTTSGM